ncbi:MAG: GspH/FimT family pseudopilin [Rubrivivax sp.]|nr:GspH/FimT family pseudopilin [Rubrivivax sp.]
MKHRPTAGLTLLELAIVMAVMAVLAALALPSLGAQLAHKRLQSAAQALADDITNARFEAAGRGQALQLEFEAGAAWCWAVTATPGCACGQAQACQLQRVRSVDHAQVRLLQARALRLDPAGTAPGGEVALLESARGERLRVEVSPLGRPRVCAVAGVWPALPAC